MTNRMGHHNNKFPLPSWLQTSWEQGNSSLPTWNSSCNLKWMRDSHCHSYTVHWQNMLSKPPIICFMTDVFQREKKTENLWNNPWTSLKFVLWWLLEKMENTDNSTRFVTKFHFTVSWEHLPFFDLRVGRGSTCCSMHCHGSARAYSKQVLHDATSMLSVE